MHRFFDSVIRPLLDVVRPRLIVEVGAEAGEHTRKLLEWADDVVVEVIDPAPKLDATSWKSEFGDRLVIHQERSLNALPRLTHADVVLIDGDHNWYTVRHELELIERAAQHAGHELPVVALHDLGWPYGRRDLYYMPEAIPAAYRQPYEQLGMRPGTGELDPSGGLNPHLYNAIYEHDARNGVRTAVEDFLRETEQDIDFLYVPGLHGLGLLVSADRVQANKPLRKKLAYFRSAEFLAEICELVERERVEQQISHEAKREADRAQRPPPDRAKEAQARVTELEKALEASERESAQRAVALMSRDHQVEHHETALRELQSALSEQAPEAVRLRIELEHAITSRDDAVAEVAAIEARLASLTRRDRELESQLLARAEETGRAESELRRAQRRFQRLETQLEAQQTDQRKG